MAVRRDGKQKKVIYELGGARGLSWPAFPNGVCRFPSRGPREATRLMVTKAISGHLRKGSQRGASG